MKGTKINFVLSFISIGLALTVLILTCLGWYVQNTQATTDASEISTKNTGIYDVQMNRYVANKAGTSETEYVKGDLLTDEKVSEVTFDLLGEYHKVIYEISFRSSLEQVALFLHTSTTKYDPTLKLQSGGYVNYLSNVAEFFYLTESESGFEISNFFDASEKKEFSFEEGQTRADSLILNQWEITSSDTLYTLDLLFDYDSDHINRIFYHNLGTDAGNAVTISFEEDIDFIFSAL